MAEHVREHIRKCTLCKQNKPSNRSQLPEPGRQRITTKPFQIIAIDFIQSLPRSKSGYAHLFVIMDLFSKWCLLVPVKRISASQVANILEEAWFRRYSVPEYLISDNATTFLSKEIKSLLLKYGIQHWANSRHHSQANPVERLNRTINSCIRSYVKQDQRLWDTRVSEIEHCLNNTPHTATGFSPYRILFGHEIITKGEEHRLDKDERDLSEEERGKRKEEIDEKIYSLVSKNLKKAHENAIKTYQLRSKHSAPVYTVGQKVYKRNFRPSSATDKYNSKLGPLYLPCSVIARVGTSSYELADESGRPIGVFSVADLKPDH